MKIYADTDLLYEISPLEKRILEDEVNKERLEQSIKDQIQWAVQSRIESAYEKLKREWLPILFKRYPSVPTGKKELLDLILSQPDYRDQFMKENKAQTLETQKFVVS